MSLTINNGLIIGLEPKKPTKAQPEELEPTKQEETPDTGENQLNNIEYLAGSVPTSVTT